MAVEEKEFVEDAVTVEEDTEQTESEVVEDTEVELSARDKIAADYAAKQKAEFEDEGENGEEAESANDVESVEEDEEKLNQTEVIVNGQRYMVDNDKIKAAGGIELYQKSRAANEGLQEVAKQRKILEDERKRFIEEQRSPQKNLPPAGDSINGDYVRPIIDRPPHLPGSPDDNKELVKRYHNAVYDGDEDLAQELFGQIISQRSAPVQVQPQVNPEEVARVAAEKVRHEMREEAFSNEVEQARISFESDFPDIASDSQARKLANDRTIELMNLHPSWTPSQIVTEAGVQVRDWMNSLGVNTASSNSSKIAYKRKLGSVKAAGGRASAKPQPKPQTNSNYVESLQRSRGQI